MAIDHQSLYLTRSDEAEAGFVRRLLREMAAAWHPDPESFAVQVLAFMDGLQLSWLRDPAIDVVAEWEAFADRLFPVRRVRSGI